MSSITKRATATGYVYDVRYRDPSGKQCKKTFAKKSDATRYETTVEGSKLVGSYIDPTLARITVGEWADRWFDGQSQLKPSTRERYAGILRAHIKPRWDGIRLADVTFADVQAWVAGLSTRRAPATVHKVHGVLSLVLDMAVKDGRVARNVAAGVSLPRVVGKEHRYLTHAQVRALADKCGDPYRLIVLFLAYTGSGGARWRRCASSDSTHSGAVPSSQNR